LLALFGGHHILHVSRIRVNAFTTNEDIATKFEANLPHCVRNVKEKDVLLFEFRCNIFIAVRIIKDMPGSVASGTPVEEPRTAEEAFPLQSQYSATALL
jgi:hypothetical protein